MGPVGKCEIGCVDVREKILHQSSAKARTRRQIPIVIIRENDDKRNRLTRLDEGIDDSYRAQANPLIVSVGLPVQEIKDRITLIRFFVVAGREIDPELLRRPGGIQAAQFQVTGLRETGKRRDGSRRNRWRCKGWFLGWG